MLKVESLQKISEILKNSRFVDLTVLLENGIPRWPSHPHLVIDQTVTHEHDGYYCQSINMAEHTGTHVDAPYHSHEDLSAKTIEKIKIDSLIGTCKVIDFSTREWKPGERLKLSEVKEYLLENKLDIEKDDIVLFNFGWLDKYWTNTSEWKYYSMNQPGMDEELADYLIEKNIKAVGTDTIAVGTPVVDGVSEVCYFHEKVLRKDIYLMECLENLKELPKECLFIAAPLKIVNGSGSPIRALAVIPQ